MSKAKADEATADDARELNELAGELYGLHPDAFAAARDERVRAARADGRKALARELGGLRRPSMSAWLINLLWRDQPDVVDQFLQLAGELSRAQAEASGPELHRLTALRRELEAALIRTARALAQKAGANVSASMEREAQETLSAALARPEVAEEVRTGRLVKPAAYAGFGTVMPGGLSATAPAPGRPPASNDTEAKLRQSSTSPLPMSADREARDAQRARERRAEAERSVQTARGSLVRAADDLTESVRAAEAAHEQHETLCRRVEELEAQLRKVQKEAAAVEQAAAEAARRREQAEKAHETALETFGRAEQELQDLPRP